MELKVKKLSESATVPTKNLPSDAGIDLYASEQVVIPANGRALVKTEIAMAIPEGYCGLVVGRSGNTIKRGLVGQLGIVDSHYRDSVGIMMFNTTSEDIVIKAKERAGQIVLVPFLPVELTLCDELDETDRKGGFGSSGK